MLLSMTGFGDARWQGPALTIGVELRSVNNRFLKISVKAPEAYQCLEADIERLVRDVIKRGTVNVFVNVHREYRPDDYQLNTIALGSYYEQLQAFAESRGISGEMNLASLLSIPGVVEDAASHTNSDPVECWAVAGPVVQNALKKLQGMRSDEGQKMAQELTLQAELIASRLAQIIARAPDVSGEYRKRLHDKVQNVLNEHSIVLDPSTLIKEVAVFADRTDINEEVVRLGSHLEQFHSFLKEDESTGRKLDFLIQEMNREVNTIGSKANDIPIARHVVEMKGAIEKMREIIQNVE